MTGVWDGINAGVGKFVVGGLGTGFDGDAGGITLRVYKLIDIGFVYTFWGL